jgi:hypothetical protein
MEAKEARQKKRQKKEVSNEDKENEAPQHLPSQEAIKSPVHKRAKQTKQPRASTPEHLNKTEKEIDILPSTPPCRQAQGGKTMPSWAPTPNPSTSTTSAFEKQELAIFSPNSGSRTPDASMSIPTFQTPIFHTIPSFSTPIALSMLQSPPPTVRVGGPTPFAVPLQRDIKHMKFLPLTPVSSWPQL